MQIAHTAQANKRSSSWQHDEGPEATRAALQQVWEKHMDEIVELNTSVYSSSDMKAGLDMAMLESRASLLTKCVGVDPRGGIVRQSSMEDSLQGALEATGKMAAFEAASKEGGAIEEFSGPTTCKDYVALTSYKVRVMLSHLRDQYDRGHATDALMEIFAITTTGKSMWPLGQPKQSPSA